MKKWWILPVVVSILALVVIVVTTVLVRNTAKTEKKGSKPHEATAPQSTLVPLLPSTACAATEVKCNTDQDCAVQCASSVPSGNSLSEQYVNIDRTEYTCQDIGGGGGDKFCLPPKPEAKCANGDVPGVLRWQGWGGVDTQGWSCACEFPDFYPPRTGDGACMASPQLCVGGHWKFPCDEDGKCGDELDEATRTALLGSSPFFNGKCVCDQTTCTRNDECVSSSCVNGKCVGQRPGVDPLTGLPTCVVDTCVNDPSNPAGNWVESGDGVPGSGWCECRDDAALTGNGGCMFVADISKIVRPAAYVCENDCGGRTRGRCLPGGVCECVAGYEGPACENFTCTNHCVGMGECIGPNKCTCAKGQVWNAVIRECMSPVDCSPAPSVDPYVAPADPLKDERYAEVSNSYNFPNATRTACGSSTDLAAFCKSFGYDGSFGPSECVKYPACDQLPCTDAQLCADSDTMKLLEPKQHVCFDQNGAATCCNPSKVDLEDACDAKCKPGDDDTCNLVYTSGVIDGVWKCMDGTMQELLVLDNVVVELNGDITGFVTLEMDTVPEGLAPFQGMYVLERGDEGLASGFAQVYPAASDHYPRFAFFASYPLSFDDATVPPVEGESIKFEFGLIPYWSSRRPLFGTKQPPLTIVVSPAPSACLRPVLAPPIAMKIAKTHDLAVTALKGAGLTPTSEFSGDVGMSVDVGDPNAQVVQAACTSAYCDASTTHKLVIVAWKDQTGQTTCGCVPVYTLSVTNPVSGQSNVLVGEEGHAAARYVDPVEGAFFYYIDVVSLEGVEKTLLLRYMLSATCNDVTSTKEMVVTLTPYTEAYCESLPSPDPSVLMPNMHWLQGNACHWEPSNRAANDYYCSTVANEFNKTNLRLVNDGNSECGALMASFPQKKDNEWNDGCELTSAEADGKSIPPKCHGTQQTRTVECSPSLKIETGGTVADSTNFDNRMSALLDFYRRVNGTKEDAVTEALRDPNLYSNYYNCGPAAFGNSWATSALPCATKDTTCSELTTTACADGDSCSTWARHPDDVKLYSQVKVCYPRDNTAACCSHHGTYKLAGDQGVDVSRATCTCSGEYTGPTCAIDACEGQTCNGQGTCGFDGTRTKCTCNQGYFNTDPVDAAAKDPVQNFMTCNKVSVSYGSRPPIDFPRTYVCDTKPVQLTVFKVATINIPPWMPVQKLSLKMYGDFYLNNGTHNDYAWAGMVLVDAGKLGDVKDYSFYTRLNPDCKTWLNDMNVFLARLRDAAVFPSPFKISDLQQGVNFKDDDKSLPDDYKAMNVIVKRRSDDPKTVALGTFNANTTVTASIGESHKNLAVYLYVFMGTDDTVTFQASPNNSVAYL